LGPINVTESGITSDVIDELLNAELPIDVTEVGKVTESTLVPSLNASALILVTVYWNWSNSSMTVPGTL